MNDNHEVNDLKYENEILKQKIKELEDFRKKYEVLFKEMQEIQDRFTLVTDTINEVFWMTDPLKNKMFFINKAYERIWGKSIKSLLEDPESYLSTIHPDDLENVLASLPLQKEDKYNIEYRILNANGEVRWIHDQAYTIKNEKGQVYRVVGVARDITENKLLINNLNIEKQKTEYLLQNILPKTIIEELKKANLISFNSPIIAKNIPSSTVLFCDIVGFTEFSRIREAKIVVNKLNRLFKYFDELVDNFGVEKIKTIGDNYMLAAGVPSPLPDHAKQVCQLALEMLDKLSLFNKEENESFQLRIGIHTGPVVAGVIGMKKYIYDIWGDTVNTASRMESSSLPNKIHVSESIYLILKDDFIFEERSLIELKGIGKIKTYFLIENRK